MKPLELLYWFRLLLGIAAAFLCIGYGLATNTIIEGYAPTVFMNGLSLAIILYIISYWMIKPKLILKVDDPRKILTTGIGIYFLSWLVFWILLYTFMLVS